jgi:hypothetical protein
MTAAVVLLQRLHGSCMALADCSRVATATGWDIRSSVVDRWTARTIGWRGCIGNWEPVTTGRTASRLLSRSGCVGGPMGTSSAELRVKKTGWMWPSSQGRNGCSQGSTDRNGR